MNEYFKVPSHVESNMFSVFGCGTKLLSNWKQKFYTPNTLNVDKVLSGIKGSFLQHS